LPQLKHQVQAQLCRQNYLNSKRNSSQKSSIT
jgi:hypothetical protein